MFLGGLNPKEFLNDCKEWHAVVIGFCEGVWPWGTGHKLSDDLKKQVQDEYHYYISARVVGIISLVGFAIGIYKVLT